VRKEYKAQLAYKEQQVAKVQQGLKALLALKV
jgi:hypothetical protein